MNISLYSLISSEPIAAAHLCDSLLCHVESSYECKVLVESIWWGYCDVLKELTEVFVWPSRRTGFEISRDVGNVVLDR